MYFRNAITAVFLITVVFGASTCQDNDFMTLDVKSISDVKKTNICTNGALCRENTDCIDGICVQGVCKCDSTSLCQSDDDCGENRCCNIMSGSCYDCSKDVISDYEEILTDEVADDIVDVDMSDIGDSATVECESDFSCTIENPYCNPQKNICVQCYENRHCSTGECDVESGRCKDISEDGGVDVISDILSDVSIDTGGDVFTDVGDPCLNYICLCGTICVVENGNPTCKNGCKTGNDCCTNTICKNGQCEKTLCTEDADCKDQSKPHCEIISGVCYECTNDLHCQSDYYCDSNYVCKYKVDACYGQCKSNQWCNPSTGICEDIPSNWCVACSQPLDPICLLAGLTCGFTTKKCTRQCNDDNECYGYTCNLFGWCTCP